jgi:predicted ATPase
MEPAQAENWLQLQRGKAGLTQEDLAGLSGVSVRTIADLEHGRTRRPYPSSVRSLVRALGLPDAVAAELVSQYRIGVPAQQRAETTPAPRSGELPAEVTGFVGRHTELAQLAGLLRTAKLITVTGPGGVGKTRVALRAAGAASEFADGVHLVELAGLQDPELLPHTIAACLGLPEQHTRTQLDVLLHYLRDRHLLLVLDTCEHMVDACAWLADVLLRQTAQVTILATSRQPLDVPGEHTCPIRPLPVPDAVELFAQSARAVLPGFAITEANRDDVIELCRHLDGIPLAIELATVRLRAVPLKQLACRLKDRFRLLTGGHRAVLPHQQTLYTTIGWSYDLCSPTEQLLWARLSVFAGSFDVAAAEEVCAGAPLTRDDIMPALIGLADKSVALQALDADDDIRYLLLDSIREYGAARLAEADPATQTLLRSRHVARYGGMARSFGARPAVEDQLDRYHRLRREHANIRAALGYAFTLPGREREAAGLAADLYIYWMISGLFAEGCYWIDKALDRFPAQSSERAWLLVSAACLGIHQGAPADALVALDEGIAMAEKLGDEVTAFRGYLFRTQALAACGRAAEAAAAGMTAAQACGFPGGLLILDAVLSYTLLCAGEPAKAIAACRQGLARLPAGSRERLHQGWLHLTIGMAQFLLGQRDASGASLRTSLKFKHELGDNVGISLCLEALGWVAGAEQRHDRAARLLGAAGALRDRSGVALSGFGVMMAQHHQRTAAAAATFLGPEQYAPQHRQGAALPLDQAVTLALAPSAP